MSNEPSPSIGEGPFHKLPSPPMTPQRNSQATLQALDEDLLQNDKTNGINNDKNNDVSINVNETENEKSEGEESADVAEVAIRETPKHGWRTYAAFGTLCLVTFIVALDSTIICVAVPVSYLQLLNIQYSLDLHNVLI
jgi:hypothetical protein